jgi:DNA replication initiation complex subunit (GINS family)
MLDAVKLHKIHWKERVQPANQVSSLPDDFYPKLRRYLVSAKGEIAKSVEKMKEYEKATRLAHDIIDCRLKKITFLASSPAQTDQFLQNLAREERLLYDRLYEIINDWKSNIIKGGDKS